MVWFGREERQHFGVSGAQTATFSLLQGKEASHEFDGVISAVVGRGGDRESACMYASPAQGASSPGEWGWGGSVHRAPGRVV
jgi:hypothetical protein